MWENYLNEYFKLVLLSLKKRGRVWRSIKNEVCGHPNQYPWHLNKKSKLTELQMNSSSEPFSIKFILLLGFSWWFAVNIFIASIDPLPKRGRHPLLAGMISSLQSCSGMGGDAHSPCPQCCFWLCTDLSLKSCCWTTQQAASNCAGPWECFMVSLETKNCNT